MKIIDFEEFVSLVVEEKSAATIRVNGSMMAEVRHELLLAGIACDFSPGAIETFAYHYPQNVKVSHFEIVICPNEGFTQSLWKMRPSNRELMAKVSPVWKKIKK